MSNSKITIKFNTVMIPDNFISFEIKNTSNNQTAEIKETWQIIRKSKGIIDIPTVGLPDSIRFSKYFNIDYNGVSQYTVNNIGNDTIEIISNFSWIEFINPITNSDAVITISNAAAYSNFEITESSVLQATINCDNIIHNIKLNKNCKKYILDNNETIVDTNELNITYPRGQEFSIVLIDEDNQKINFPTETKADLFQIVKPIFKTVLYDKLLLSNISISITTLFNGSTIKIDVTKVEGLDLSYSIDGTNYQTSNIFSSQADGNYTLYVKDQFNCIKSKQVEVTGNSSLKPFFKISETNSIPFIEILEYDNVETFKNNDNSFSCKSLSQFSYFNNILYNKFDKPTIQIKSNFKDLSVKLRSESGVENEVVFVQKSNNLDRYENIDCIYYKHSSGKLGLYFNSGNIYDNLNIVIGNYELNGNLPLFAKIGNIVNIDGIGALPIYNTVIDSDINKKVIIFDQVYDGQSVSSKCQSIYNLLNYNIYEIPLDFINLNDGLYDILIEANHQDGTELKYLSENILISDNHENTLSIYSFNDYRNNRDIFYKYNIKHFIRTEYSQIKTYIKEDSEININDNNSSSIKSTVNKGETFIFEDLTEKQALILSLNLSLENVIINGISYIKDGDINLENIENTNIYKLEINMLRTGKSFNNNEIVNSGSDELFEELYIPKLLTSGVNFIKL